MAGKTLGYIIIATRDDTDYPLIPSFPRAHLAVDEEALQELATLQDYADQRDPGTTYIMAELREMEDE